jgi:hypothetical protein
MICMFKSFTRRKFCNLFEKPNSILKHFLCKPMQMPSYCIDSPFEIRKIKFDVEA